MSEKVNSADAKACPACGDMAPDDRVWIGMPAKVEDLPNIQIADVPPFGMIPLPTNPTQAKRVMIALGYDLGGAP